MTSGRGGENYGCGWRKRYICSKCGKTGHNRQTCGKTVPGRPPTHHPVVSPSRPARIETNFSSMADLVGETPPVSTETSISVTTSPLLTGTADLIDEDMVLTGESVARELPSNRWNDSEWEEETNAPHGRFYRNVYNCGRTRECVAWI